jgi:hypothetical protein
MLYPVKVFFNLDREIRIFQDKDILKNFMSTKTALQKIFKGLFQIEEENNHKHERIGRKKT